MSTRWKVSYIFRSVVDVQKPILAYNNIRVLLHYDGNNKLARIEHKLDIAGSLNSSEVINTSEEQLKFFWELLHYLRGVPLSISRRAAKEIKQITSNVPTASTGIATITSSTSICNSIEMPSAKVFDCENSRLLVWLRLANEAQNSKNGVDAIRNYYMIWEDLHSKEATKENTPREAVELKFARDFISHGKKMTNPELLNFLKAQFGKTIEQFDPTDSIQQDFVKHYRTLGRKLVEKEIEKEIEKRQKVLFANRELVLPQTL